MMKLKMTRALRVRKDAVATMDDAWQPIETAPTDGEPFLGAIYWGKADGWTVLRMRYDDYYKRFVDATYAPFGATQEQPSHWQPMPEPPKAKGPAGGRGLTRLHAPGVR